VLAIEDFVWLHKPQDENELQMTSVCISVLAFPWLQNWT
jgi:hypothetical protein